MPLKTDPNTSYDDVQLSPLTEPVTVRVCSKTENDLVPRVYSAFKMAAILKVE